MRRWMLSLFREFRELERERDRNVELQTRMAEQARVIDWLKDELGEARRGEVRATQALANFSMQLKFGAVPFPDAPAIPEAAITPVQMDPPPPQYLTASAVLAKRQRGFIDQLEDKLKKIRQENAA